MPPAFAFPTKVLQGKGTQLRLVGYLGCREKWGDVGLRFCKSVPHLHTQRICTSGPNPNRGPGQRAILSSLPRAKQGEKGRPASRVMLRGPHCCNLHPTLLPHPTSCFHPSCRCACFDPNSVQGWAEGGQQPEPGPASPSSPAACTPCFSALWHAAFIAQSPDSPPRHTLSCPPEPLRRRLGEQYSSLLSTHPSLHRAPREEA